MSTPLILDGKALAKNTEAELSRRVAQIMRTNGNRTPILATILVGSDPASATYVRMKGNACRRVGMDSMKVEMSEETTTEELLAKIDELNANQDVHGILLQHPVPEQVDERRCFDRITVTKDVDGVTALGFGLMTMGEPVFGSATPAGIICILDHYKIDIGGKHAVVIGRSPILGKPVAMMLLNRNATVTICHSRTQNLPEVVRTADIIVAAVGRPRFVQADWVKPGAVIIDAGFHPEGCGDVDLESAAPLSSAYTPVPGGVGPMTISMLIQQTVHAAERAAGITQ
ncbi:MAG: bifunctional methylenetetrahydrofolate dehydrogenase/methenyltetrahydrofolate cyclohydrolase FolD [Myxococcota bacterium]|nr:bifunctional methylenetetrahydrofolate dehydrogenase/methenyltetrahydrofolate cyclohydrolase FolD [Myxococcota bacterium]